MKVEFVNKASLKIKRVVKKSILQTLEYLGQSHKNLEVCVMFVSDEEMKDLNNRTRSINKTTDVLSFPAFQLSAGELLNQDVLAEKNIHLGDMAISLAKATEQAISFCHSTEAEVSKLAVHSTLHLMGYDHIQDSDFEKMQPIEVELERILKNKKVI